MKALTYKYEVLLYSFIISIIPLFFADIVFPIHLV